MRRKNGVAMPFADKGANTTDGHEWEVGRNLIKPYFMKDAFSNTDRLETHTDKLLALIPTDGSMFDLQTLLQRWVRLFVPSPFPFQSHKLLKLTRRVISFWTLPLNLRSASP